MRQTCALLCLALAAWVGFAPPAWAGDVTWNYSFSGTSTIPNADGGSLSLILGKGSGSTTGLKTYQSSLLVAGVKAAGADGQFLDTPYDLAMHLVDGKSGQSTDLEFSGTVSGNN